MRTLHASPPATPEHPGSTPVFMVRPTSTDWLWVAGGALLFFAVPFVGTDMFGLQPDLFYLVYFTIAVLWFAAFLAANRSQLHDLWRLNLTWSLLVGALAGIAV